MKGDDGVINKGDHLDEDCGRVELLNDCLDGFPFLHRPDPDLASIAERERLLGWVNTPSN